ncbi:MAG TPA: alpha/beta fold hydrolase [Candidatus Krumholzibacteria bacterium]|nr:alpha/beta fold hydrolase [Candidatus Krumholzibacteria bacterium]
MMRRILVGWVVLVAAAAAGAGVVGVWDGVLEVPGGSLALVLHVDEDDAGAWSASLDSPDQGVFGMKAGEVRWEAPRLTVDFPSLSARYVGAMDAAGANLEGTWSQGGGALPLALVRRADGPPRRPQMPVPPFPYESADVTVRNQAAGVDLAGTFTVPPGDGPFATVLLLTGSGAQDRDETILGHKPFLVLADHLSRTDVAVLRLDDRGVGGSDRGPAGATTADFARDALAAVAWLRARPEVDARRLGLLGHSEGGLIAAVAAAQDPGVGFLVLLAGPAVPGSRILAYQGARGMARIPGYAAEEPRVRAALAQLYAAPLDSVEAVLTAVAADLGAPLAALTGLTPANAPAIRTQISDPWLRWFLDHDPAPDLAALDIPVLALFGTKDTQVPPSLNADPMRAVLHNPHSRVEVFPDLNHLFQPAVTGELSEYEQIETTISPEVLQALTAFILQR